MGGTTTFWLSAVGLTLLRPRPAARAVPRSKREKSCPSCEAGNDELHQRLEERREIVMGKLFEQQRMKELYERGVDDAGGLL